MTATCVRGTAAVSILHPATRRERTPVLSAAPWLRNCAADLVLGLCGAAFGVPLHRPSSEHSL